MSYTYDDAILDDYETSPERYEEAIEESLRERDTKDLTQSIKNGHHELKELIEQITGELERLDPVSHPRSYILLNLTLLEIIERDIIFFPLLFSSKTLFYEAGSKVYKLIKESVDRNVNAFGFICKFYEHETNRSAILNDNLKTLISNRVPGHDFLISRENPYKFRKLINDFRNTIVHGRRCSKENEARLISEFINLWRDEVFNSILRSYGLRLGSDWSLH